MSAYKPSGAYCVEFVVSSATGAAADADALPVATVNKNGTDDGSSPTGWSNSLTVAKIDTGRYKITGTIPSAYASGDVVNMSVAATVGGIAAKCIVDTFIVDTKRNADLQDLAAGAEMTLTSAYNAAKTAATQASMDVVDGIVDTIKTKTDGLNFTGTDVKATLDGETVTASSVTDKSGYTCTVSDKTGFSGTMTVSDKTGFALTADYDAAKTAASATNLTNLTNTVGTAGAGLTALGDTRLANLDATMSSRAAAATALSTAVWTGTKAGYLDAAVSSVSAGDATAANQTTIINHLTGIKGSTWNGTTDSLEAIRNRGDAAWTTGAVSEDKAVVDHNTGGTDALRYLTTAGLGISGATIRAYLKADYDAGTFTLRATTTTTDSGRWATPLYLDHTTAYTLVFEKDGSYGPDEKEITTS